MSEPSTDATLLSIDAGVATITLNRPDNRNALSTDLVAGLSAHLDAAVADPAAHVIVLTGAGNTFCAGADLKERRAAGGAVEEAGDLPLFVRVFQRIQGCSKPVVGRINGHALAGGLGLAAACDISVASARATFGFTEVRIGVAPAVISVICLPKLRAADAAELFLCGERVDAATAARVGLINKAVPEDELDAAVAEVVGKLLLGGPNALAASKSLLTKVPAFASQEDAYRWASQLSNSLFSSEEGMEGMKAFAEKRPPAWVTAVQR